jgi:uncharacterized repeat protein (TIGR03803 family)
LTRGTNGEFYGTTSKGGLFGAGTVFKITRSGVLTTLYSFSGLNDGGKPLCALQARDGSFYGTTSLGGTFGKGTVFKLTPAK